MKCVLVQNNYIVFCLHHSAALFYYLPWILCSLDNFMNTSFAYYEIILFGIKIVSKNKRVHSHLKFSIENLFFFNKRWQFMSSTLKTNIFLIKKTWVNWQKSRANLIYLHVNELCEKIHNFLKVKVFCNWQSDCNCILFPLQAWIIKHTLFMVYLY